MGTDRLNINPSLFSAHPNVILNCRGNLVKRNLAIKTPLNYSKVAVRVNCSRSWYCFVLSFTDCVSVIGSDDATTCHLVVLRHTGNVAFIRCMLFALFCQRTQFVITAMIEFHYFLGSGAVCLAHCDGSSTWSEVPVLVKAVTSLSNVSNGGRYETHRQTHSVTAHISHCEHPIQMF